MKKALWLIPLLLAIPLFAVTPQFWETRTHDDFRKGKLTNLSLTADDELVLAPKFQTVFNTEQTLIWSTVADSKGNVYLGTGHDGKIYKVDSSGKGSMIAGGDPKGYVYRISPDGKAFVLYDSGMREVHSVAVGPNGTIYAAVISGEAPIAPSPATTSAADRPLQGGQSITVTLGSTSEEA